MTATTVRVFVNEQGVSIPVGATALDAVRALFPDDASGIEAGTLKLTDSRGLPIAHDVVPPSGAIFRVIAHRERLPLESA